MKNVTLIQGQARFTAPRTLDVGGKRSLQADKIFLNVGGRARGAGDSRASTTCPT